MVVYGQHKDMNLTNLNLFLQLHNTKNELDLR